MSAPINTVLFAGPAAARQAFADLLKIPLAAPGVRAKRRHIREEDGLIVEDVCWESLDGERPTALVVSAPANDSGPRPALLCLHGTGGSRESVCAPMFGTGTWTPHGGSPHVTLLGWGRELARRGYVVLALTQRGLDVRTPDTNDQAKDLLVRGRTLMGAIVYEIRQAVTYLQNRGDVDPARIGMTGMSFGGITTFYSWLVDERIAATAPICGGVGSVDVFLRRGGARGYHGFYWWIPNMLTKGDQGDFAAALAPRPLMLWAPLSDIGMPREGVDRFLDVVAPAYAKAGASAALAVHRPPGEHDFTPEAFAALAAFFDTHLTP